MNMQHLEFQKQKGKRKIKRKNITNIQQKFRCQANISTFLWSKNLHKKKRLFKNKYKYGYGNAIQ